MWFRRQRVWGVFAAGVVLLGAAAAVGANLTGTKGPDSIRGTNGPDRIKGRSGADKIRGRGGRDRLRGDRGRDVLFGGPERDKLQGGRGDDILRGGRGTNKLQGGRGRDGFAMRDGVQIGSPGNDVIRARDGNPDEINCGAGYDKVFLDQVEDGVYECEVVKLPGPPE